MCAAAANPRALRRREQRIDIRVVDDEAVVGRLAFDDPVALQMVEMGERLARPVEDVDRLQFAEQVVAHGPDVTGAVAVEHVDDVPGSLAVMIQDFPRASGGIVDRAAVAGVGAVPVPIDDLDEAVGVLRERRVHAHVGAADVGRVLREDRVSHERLPFARALDGEGGQPRSVTREMDRLDIQAVHLEVVAVGERRHVDLLAPEGGVAVEEGEQFLARAVGDLPRLEGRLLASLVLDQRRLLARDQRRVGLVSVNGRAAGLLDHPRQPGVVVVPVGQEHPIHVGRREIERGQPVAEFRTRRVSGDAGVDEHGLLATEEIDVVLPLENGVPEPDTLHTAPARAATKRIPTSDAAAWERAPTCRHTNPTDGGRFKHGLGVSVAMPADLYDVLGIPDDASAEELKRAYRERVREYHPDVNEHPEGDAQFKLVRKAHDVLSDPAERKDYDRLGHREYVEKRLDELPPVSVFPDEDLPDDVTAEPGASTTTADEPDPSTAAATESTDDDTDSPEQSNRSPGGAANRQDGEERASTSDSGNTTADAGGEERSTTDDAEQRGWDAATSTTRATSTESTVPAGVRRRRGLKRWYGVVAFSLLLYLGGLGAYANGQRAAASEFVADATAAPLATLLGPFPLGSPTTYLFDAVQAVTAGAPQPGLALLAGTVLLPVVVLTTVGRFGRGAAWMYAVPSLAPAICVAAWSAIAVPTWLALVGLVVFPVLSGGGFLVDVGRYLRATR